MKSNVRRWGVEPYVFLTLSLDGGLGLGSCIFGTQWTGSRWTSEPVWVRLRRENNLTLREIEPRFLACPALGLVTILSCPSFTLRPKCTVFYMKKRLHCVVPTVELYERYCTYRSAVWPVRNTVTPIPFFKAPYLYTALLNLLFLIFATVFGCPHSSTVTPYILMDISFLVYAHFDLKLSLYWPRHSLRVPVGWGSRNF
jgi:hypothetical protein